VGTWGGIARAAAAALLCLGGAGRGDALVTVSDPDDPLPFFRLYRPTGQLDETALSGFEFLISSREGEFRANDQYLIAGEATEETTSLGADLGAVGDLSGTPFHFSIEHHLAGGRNFTFHLWDDQGLANSVLCWGQSCPAGSTAVERLDGRLPIDDYNGLQIQVRAQDVAGASAAVTVESLVGVDVTGAELLDELVTPTTPGTIPGDLGRRGQWLLADDLDLVLSEWTLTGLVTLVRPDAALADVTKVRLAVDLVRDPELAYLPEPSPVLLVGLGLAALARRRGRAAPTGGR
jgi:hypothetical protein